MTTPLPEIRISEQFHGQCWALGIHDHLFGFLAIVVVQGTAPFRMQLPMQKDMPLEDILAPALAEVEKRACILDKIVFTAAKKAPKMGEGEKFEAKIIETATK